MHSMACCLLLELPLFAAQPKSMKMSVTDANGARAGGIMKCDVIAQGIVNAAKKVSADDLS